jgi:hypothetical protein
MWARQFASNGRLVISQDGTVDDWRAYYPNTVPKPLELLLGFLRLPEGAFYRSALTGLTGLWALYAVWAAAGKGFTGNTAALFLGMNPAFIFLTLSGNPAIPFIAAVMLTSTMKWSTAGALAASLSRPEGFLYGAHLALRNRSWKLIALLTIAAGIWLAFHRTACGSFTWASDEVRYCVAAMAYPTPNSLTLLPWAFLRSILILGPPAAAVFWRRFGKWELRVPFALNFLLLGVSLAAGSLVLPRYIDQLFLLAVPFVCRQLPELNGQRRKLLVSAALILSPGFQWFAVLPEISEAQTLQSIYRETDLPSSGVTAANELVVPGLCLANGINDPRGLFISTDRAAFEKATEDELLDFGVGRIIVVPMGFFHPEHTGEWLKGITEIEVDHRN